MLIDRDVHPEQLMHGIGDSGLLPKLLMSIGIHVAVIGLTSVPFLMLCSRYHTMNPRPVIAKEEEARKLAEAEEKAKRLQEEKQKAAAAKPATKPDATKGSEPPAGTGTEVKGDTPIEKAISDTSDERPTSSSVGFDNVDDLE